ncbi:unnamed protein product [Amoebophrya sp. A120]|nr:unnamed protein product [Amoebophrya sp. A120]|eukprot:GSA120T00004583001.1
MKTFAKIAGATTVLTPLGGGAGVHGAKNKKSATHAWQGSETSPAGFVQVDRRGKAGVTATCTIQFADAKTTCCNGEDLVQGDCHDKCQEMLDYGLIEPCGKGAKAEEALDAKAEQKMRMDKYMELCQGAWGKGKSENEWSPECTSIFGPRTMADGGLQG